MKPMMLPRRVLLLGIACAATLVGACSDDMPTSATTQDNTSAATKANNDTAITATTRLLTPSSPAPMRDSITGAPIDPEFSTFNFPERLALTESQKTAIRALRRSHTATTAADSAVYLGILEQARAARAAGKPSTEIDAILASAALVAERLAAARVKFDADVQNVLSTEQREWLAKCRGPISITAAQQQQINALQAAYTADNAADLASVQAALTQINAIRADSATYNSPAKQEQVRQILENVKPARDRLSAAQQLLSQKVAAILGVTACGR